MIYLIFIYFYYRPIVLQRITGKAPAIILAVIYGRKALSTTPGQYSPTFRPASLAGLCSCTLQTKVHISTEFSS